ncbi:glycosyltransferase [uncultured Modestobacter sp.]|uniref:glycosyltransferase family 2 protein n=1 Tax=uncultured Modestobacter sp. TaxID=380048 RepID=UPI00260DD769|nr:glycosyltransferase [uncultured Modestobacter sp.]
MSGSAAARAGCRDEEWRFEGEGADPTLTVVTVLDADAGGEPAADLLTATWASLRAQHDPRWQWVVVTVSGVPAPPSLTGPAEDSRVVVHPATPGEMLAEGLRVAAGALLLVLPVGDTLAAEAVGCLGAAAGDGGWLYSDELLPRNGESSAWHRWEKPTASPELLLAQPDFAAGVAISRSALRELGGPDPRMGTAEWYDLVLRAAEGGSGGHVPEPLVRRRADLGAPLVRPTDAAAAARASCARRGLAVDDVTPVEVRGRVIGQWVRLTPPADARVSIVVPTRGSSSVVRGVERCHVVELARSVWVPDRFPGLVEFVVVHDADTPQAVLDELADIVGDGLRTVLFDEPFNFSRKCNVGAVAATGELLCFLNDDVEVLSPDWLAAMTGHLVDPDVGLVGAKLLLEDGSLQHVGHGYRDGHAGHPLLGWPANTLALGGSAQLAGARSGVTAACAVVRAADHAAVGGFSEILPLNYNDVDFCLKIRRRGQRIVYTPHAELFHFESQTRIARLLSWERDVILRRWRTMMEHDEYLPAVQPAVHGQLEDQHTTPMTRGADDGGGNEGAA